MAALKEMNQDRHGIAIDDCWNRIGVWGDEKPRCKELEKVVHCVNCKVYSGAGRLLLDRPADQDYIANWSEQLKREKNRKHENMVSVVVFRIADEWLALSARLFQEVGEMRVVHRVPHSKTKVLRCQDFAHLQIACLRSLGLATRYVSGYLLTHPPPGQPKLVGSDASHAWISVWAGELGWIDFDPTNNLMPNDEHITIGWGRDYGDVSPMNGFIIGGGAHSVAVAVDVAAAA